MFILLQFGLGEEKVESGHVGERAGRQPTCTIHGMNKAGVQWAMKVR